LHLCTSVGNEERRPATLVPPAGILLQSYIRAWLCHCRRADPRPVPKYFVPWSSKAPEEETMVQEDVIVSLLNGIGEDPQREGLRDTPARVARAYEELTRGYHQEPTEILEHAIFHERCNHMIIVRDIEVYSLCEHHMLPFFGKCHIGYIARNRVYGVSKLARLVDCYSRRLQVQERLTQQIASSLLKPVDAEGVGVVVEAQHLCMMMRGVAKQNSKMVTSAMLGSFHEDLATRNEFLNLLGMRQS
jgi:GTP cyclohydrolase I